MVRVEYYRQERIPDGRPGQRHIAPDQFDKVRAAVVACCARHGPTGPDRVAVDAGPVFWVIDDQYNDWERYQYVELVEPGGLTTAWVLDLLDVLRGHRGWRVGLQGDGWYAVLRPGRLQVTGERLLGCTSVEDCVARVGATPGS